MFADVVDPHVGRVDQPGHAGSIDDVAAPGRIFLGGREHHRCEAAHAVHHPHHIDAQHPLPVFQAVFPDQAARADAGVVEHEVGRAKTFQGGLGHCVHLGGVCHIEPEGQHLRAGGGQLGRGFVKRVLLHIGQHQVHAEPGADARAFQAETGAGAGQHRGLVFEVGDHLRLPHVS